LRGRTVGYLLWAFIACPVLGLLVVALTIGDEGGADELWFPVVWLASGVLAAVGGIALRASRPLVVAGSLLSGCVGVIVVFVLVILALAFGPEL
jgi:hypothetical protein